MLPAVTQTRNAGCNSTHDKKKKKYLLLWFFLTFMTYTRRVYCTLSSLLLTQKPQPSSYG